MHRMPVGRHRVTCQQIVDADVAAGCNTGTVLEGAAEAAAAQMGNPRGKGGAWVAEEGAVWLAWLAY